MKAGIVRAQFNDRYTQAMKTAAYEYLTSQGINSLFEMDVPGAFELGLGAKSLILSHNCDFVVCLGVVIRGETSHYDYVCKAAQEGCLNISLETLKPISFGVLTVDNYQQVYDRIWGKKGNVGLHAAQAALQMHLNLTKNLIKT